MQYVHTAKMERYSDGYERKVLGKILKMLHTIDAFAY